MKINYHACLTRDCQHMKQRDCEKEIDNHAVSVFADVMREKLMRARQKGRNGWYDDGACSNEELSQLLRDHVEKGDPRDVANLAMMLYIRDEKILPITQPTRKQE